MLSIFVLLATMLCLTKWARNLFFELVETQEKNASLVKEIEELKKTVQKLESETSKASQQTIKLPPKIKKAGKTSPNIFQRFLTRKNVNYYTGVETKSLIKIIHDYVHPFVQKRWYGASENERNFTKTPSRFGSSRFLRSIDELVLVLMRLRLGLDLRDLADRFRVSPTLAGRIFTAWIQALAAVLSHMIWIPDIETVLATTPSIYRGSAMTNLVAIIDCTEVFIETPQDFELQSTTWSDYKHHNTLKFLVAVCPNSLICYVSPSYEGRISDTELVKDCGFLELLPRQASIMADKGFNIFTDCAALGLSVEIPHGQRGLSQMPTAGVKKTKKIANLRTLIEQVISHLKTFKFLKNELSLISTEHLDEAIVVCAALCNLKEPLY